MLKGGNNTLRQTHYEVLSIREDASYEEIRASYRSAILNSHPDKLLKSSERFEPDTKLEDKFLKVQEAWDVLSDSTCRAAYDTELRASRRDSDLEVAEDVSIEDMIVEDDGETVGFFYDCRCGDCFSLDSLELEDMGCQSLREESRILIQTLDSWPASFVLPCGSCSLKIRLLINAANELSVADEL